MNVLVGCLKLKFDSTYPIHLNGILRQDEFQQSIDNINRTISSREYLIINGLVLILFNISRMILCIVGMRSILVGIGLVLFVLGMLVLSVGQYILQDYQHYVVRD